MAKSQIETGSVKKSRVTINNFGTNDPVVNNYIQSLERENKSLWESVKLYRRILAKGQSKSFELQGELIKLKKQ